MTVIREDEHSIYVKAGGYIARPVPCQWNTGYLYCIQKPEDSMHKKGDRAKAHHISQTTVTKVGDEYWHHHGTYHDTPISECWEPYYDHI